jgi:uncharacterized protein (TIGR03435 family)
MTQFVSGLARLMPNVDRDVVDRTGLTGTFDLDLTWAPDQLTQVDPNGPSLFTALQEQLGLRLESTTGPVRVLIIDRVERPNEE